MLLFIGMMGTGHGTLLTNDTLPGVYYQYYPVRVVCGVYFLWFVSVYLTRKNWWTALLGYAAAGFAVLWNTDAGLVKDRRSAPGRFFLPSAVTA